MRADAVVYATVLAFINYPFVILVDRYVRTHPVKRVFALEEPTGQTSREFHNSLVTNPVHALLFILFFATGALRAGDENLPRLLITLFLTFFWTEIWHYASHVAMHWKPLHFIHVEHHRSRVTGAWTSVSFSLLEKLIFSAGILGGLSLASRLYPLSALGVFLYYVLYFYTNTLGHANVEIQNVDYYSSWMGKVFNTPSYHALHHARYTKNYGLMTPFLDRLFGTAWEDAQQVQKSAASGRPLSKLGERLRES